jgi:predicted permease
VIEPRRSLRVYRACLRLLPARLKRHRGAMEELFAQELQCPQRRGRLAVVLTWARALGDVAGAWPLELQSRARRRQRVRLPGEERPIMVLSDIRYALRSLSRQKAASLLVASMLALGIAANVAVFSLVNGLFLRPFPFEAADRLVFINEKAPRWNLDVTGVNFPDFDQWRRSQQLFDSLAAWTERSFNLSDGSSAERIVGLAVSHEFDDVLRVRPALGRNFTVDEDTPNGPAVAVISHALWQERFGGDGAVLGRTLKLNGRAHEIVGVLPPEAEAYPGGMRLWVPLQGDPAQEGQSYSFNGIGRLKPGVTPEHAEADLLRAHQPIFDTRDKERVVSPFVLPLREIHVRDFRAAATTLTIAVALLLVVACANVAAVMLARALSRRREMGIRVALGASRLRLIRQLFVENITLAIVGGAVGLLLGQWTIQALLESLPNGPPPWAQFGLDGRVMLFALAASIGTVLVFGWAPALHAIRGDLRAAMSNVANAAAATPGGGRTLRFIIGAEFALATVLLVSGGLLFRAYDRVRDVDPGFTPEGVLTFTVSLPSSLYPTEKRMEFWDRLEARMGQLPGVRSVGLVNCPPFGCHLGSFYVAEGAPPRAADDANPVVLNRFASPTYFGTMGVRLARGRLFEHRDGRGGSEQERRVIINETFARTFFPGVPDPVGLRIRSTNDSEPWNRIVGMVADVKHYGLERPMRPGVYWPLPQSPPATLAVTLKADGDPDTIVSFARLAMRELDPELPLFNVLTMEASLRRTLATRTTYSWMLAVFALTAVTLALGGTYGVSSYLVTQRTREIGIRVALGAGRAAIVRGVLRASGAVAAVGIASGVAASFGMGRLLESLLFGVNPQDAVTLSVSVAVLAGTALLANVLPARRAARVDPTGSLRAE